MQTEKQEKTPGYPKTHSVIFKEDGADDKGIQIYPDGKITFFGEYAPNVGKPEGFEPHFKEAVKDFWKGVLEKAPEEITPEYVTRVFEPLKELFFKTSEQETRDYWNQILEKAAVMFWDQVQQDSPTKMMGEAARQMDLLSGQFESLQKDHEAQTAELEGLVKNSQEVLDLLSEKDAEIESLVAQVASEQADKEVQVKNREDQIAALEEEKKTLEAEIEELEKYKEKTQLVMRNLMD
jgi:predicted transcriptional regulator